MAKRKSNLSCCNMLYRNKRNFSALAMSILSIAYLALAHLHLICVTEGKQMSWHKRYQHAGTLQHNISLKKGKVYRRRNVKKVWHVVVALRIGKIFLQANKPYGM